jgi:hypothetical protein
MLNGWCPGFITQYVLSEMVHSEQARIKAAQIRVVVEMRLQNSLHSNVFSKWTALGPRWTYVLEAFDCEKG